MYVRYDHRKRALKQRRKKRRSTHGAVGGGISSTTKSFINTYGGFLGAAGDQGKGVSTVNVFETKQERIRAVRKKRGEEPRILL